MKRLNVRKLPVAANVCEQVLREVEVEKKHGWSMAHVIMNPLASSLFHSHERMTEIYVITKGYGELGLGVPAPDGLCRQVTAGSVFEIPAGISHMLRNKSAGHLEHLVFALPPFDGGDVHLVDAPPVGRVYSLSLPEVQDCFDGAKILPYAFPHLNLSIAFGWVINNDPERKKQPHYHERATEFVYVVEGRGFIGIGPVRFFPIQSGDWIRVDPGTQHGLYNDAPENLVVVCICSPAFQMEDVHYH